MGVCHIGKTINNFGDRWDCHRAQLRGGYNGNHKLQSDWNEYGEENFEFIIICDCTNGENLETVNNLEIATIRKYRDLGLAYNIQEGGNTGCHGLHLSEEAKRKIGEKNRINMLGRKVSEETKLKRSESLKRFYANWTDEERKTYGKRISGYTKGVKKPKLKESMKGNKNGAKYTVEQVREIRRLREQENKSYREIESIIGIPYRAVYLIATYRRWKETV